MARQGEAVATRHLPQPQSSGCSRALQPVPGHTQPPCPSTGLGGEAPQPRQSQDTEAGARPTRTPATCPLPVISHRPGSSSPRPRCLQHSTAPHAQTLQQLRPRGAPAAAVCIHRHHEGSSRTGSHERARLLRARSPAPRRSTSDPRPPPLLAGLNYSPILLSAP